MPKRYLHGPMMWKVVQRNAWKYIANLRIRPLRDDRYKVATPCMDDHQFKEEENGSVGDLSTVCSQMVLKCLYLARIGRLDIFMVREQTCSCGNEMDKSWRQTFGTFDLFHSLHMRIIAMWEIQQNNADWDCFKCLTLQETLKTQRQHQEEFCAFSEVEHFVPICWMCK